jgi:diguanylate cyclase (GGDEF)-like protein
MAGVLDFQTVAQQIVDAVIEVTDFKVATLTVREGDRCRRVATAGLPAGRVGMTTPFDHWAVLLQDKWLRGSSSYLVPPEAPARWADVPVIAPSDDPNAWTADHGLILVLRDPAQEIIGFIAVDEPRSGLLPDDPTIDRLEAFAREAQAVFVNARLYALARRQAETMAQLFDVAKTMATTGDLEQVVPRIIAAMRKRYPGAEVAVGRVLGSDAEVRVVPVGQDDVEHTLRVPMTESVLSLVDELGAKGVVLVNDLSERPDLQAWLTPGTQALLVAGMDVGDDRTVALSVGSPETAAFDDEDAEFIKGLLDITAVAIRNGDLYEEVRFAAERDALTGLRNRRMFWSTVSSLLEHATAAEPLALAVVDIDDFKQLNDQHGHDAGDRALIHVARRLEASVREIDWVFRIGGEEFVLLLPGSDAPGAMAALERVRDSVTHSRAENLPPVTISIGVAIATSGAADPDELFAGADAALFRAKRAGKDRVESAPGSG